jgi:hypothetical protein
MVVLEKEAGDFVDRHIVNAGKIFKLLLLNGVEITRVDISIMYPLFFNNNFNDAYSRNPDLQVAKGLEKMKIGRIVFDDSKFVLSDVIVE